MPDPTYDALLDLFKRRLGFSHAVADDLAERAAEVVRSAPAEVPSGRSPEQVCREAADYFDTLDAVMAKTRIKGGPADGQSLADLAGRDNEVQRDLRAVADWIRDRP